MLNAVWDVRISATLPSSPYTKWKRLNMASKRDLIFKACEKIELKGPWKGNQIFANVASRLLLFRCIHSTYTAAVNWGKLALAWQWSPRPVQMNRIGLLFKETCQLRKFLAYKHQGYLPLSYTWLGPQRQLRPGLLLLFRAKCIRPEGPSSRPFFSPKVTHIWSLNYLSKV